MEPCDSCNFKYRGCPDPLSSLCNKWPQYIKKKKEIKEDKNNENFPKL